MKIIEVNLSLGASYAIRHKRFDNLGLNMSVKLGPVQIYAVTDNLITAIKNYDSSTMNLRFGLNLVFGKPSIKEVSENKGI